MTDAELEERLPHVPWRAPFLVPGLGVVCRYCLARGGIPVGDVEDVIELFDGESSHQNHLDCCHRLA